MAAASESPELLAMMLVTAVMTKLPTAAHCNAGRQRLMKTAPRTSNRDIGAKTTTACTTSGCAGNAVIVANVPKGRKNTTAGSASARTSVIDRDADPRIRDPSEEPSGCGLVSAIWVIDMVDESRERP